jgi:ABC-type sugar transport system permease subunit
METMLRDRRAALLLVGPSLLIYSLIVLVPVVWSLVYTLFEGNVLSGFQFVGFHNFTLLVSDSSFWQALVFTVKYAVAVTIGQVGIGLLLSLLYVFYLGRASGLIRTLVFFPVVLPTVAVAQFLEDLRDRAAVRPGELPPAGSASEWCDPAMAGSGWNGVLGHRHYGHLARDGLLRRAALCRAGRHPR